MINLPKITDADVSSKKVIVRGDLDISEINGNDLRLKSLIPTLKYLLDKKAKVILIGHRGRPEGKIDNNFSLKPVSDTLEKMLEVKINFVYDIAGVEAKEESEKLAEGAILMLENLRFDTREEANDDGFAKSLASLADFYVNEAFGSSHRAHASIVGIPKLLPHAAGLHFAKEIENLSKVHENPEHPVVILISGIKKDKLDMIEPLSQIADKVLVGGRLPEFLGDAALESVRLQPDDKKVIVGNLNMDKEDITLNTVDRFIKEIDKAKTVVLAGVLGRYEDPGHRQGTEKIFKALSDSPAFKIAGGGDTLKVILEMKLVDKFDWVSVGGGAMIEFLTKKTLPGIEALKL